MRVFFVRMLRRLKQNVVAGIRLALFLKVRVLDFRISPEDYTALFVFNLLVWLVVGMLRFGFSGALNPAALSLHTFTVGAS